MMKNLEQLSDVETSGLTYNEPIEEISLNPLHDKYQKYINMAKDNYIIGFEYPMAVEVLRYCENKRRIQLGLNMNCGQCLIDLLKLFDSLRNR